jgi:hypothetical protein
MQLILPSDKDHSEDIGSVPKSIVFKQVFKVCGMRKKEIC